MGIMTIRSVQQSLTVQQPFNFRPLADAWLMSHGGQAADRGMGNQHLIRGSSAMKSGPLTRRRYGTANSETPKDPFPPEIDHRQET